MRSTLCSLMHGLWGQVATGLLAVLLTGTPVQAQNVCNTTASLVNPAAREPGIGGTGAPVLGALRAWWHALLAGAAREDPNVVAVRPGIGGTGISDTSVAGDTGGSSGTGGIGGTGIVGVITGFASICVNGVEVHYDASTPLVTDGRVAMARELAVGQVVAVRASGAGAQVAARNIAVIHAVVGPVHRVDAATGQLELLGQMVRTDNPAELSGLKTGDWAQVSGYRLFSGEVMASRIEPVTPQAQAQAQITGQISQLDASGFTMHGTRVSLDHLSLPPGVGAGTEFSVRGRWDGSSLRAQDLEMEPTRQGLGAVDRVVLEGYVHALSGVELTLGNSVVTLAPDVQISGGSASKLAVNQRVQLVGRVGADQRITVDRLDLRGDASGGGQSGRGRSGSGGSGRGGNSGNSGKGGSSGSNDGSAGSGSSSGSNSGSSGSGSSGSGSSGGGGSGGGGGGGGQK